MRAVPLRRPPVPLARRPRGSQDLHAFAPRDHETVAIQASCHVGLREGRRDGGRGHVGNLPQQGPPGRHPRETPGPPASNEGTASTTASASHHPPGCSRARGSRSRDPDLQGRHGHSRPRRPTQGLERLVQQIHHHAQSPIQVEEHGGGDANAAQGRGLPAVTPCARLAAQPVQPGPPARVPRTAAPWRGSAERSPPGRAGCHPRRRSPSGAAR